MHAPRVAPDLPIGYLAEFVALSRHRRVLRPSTFDLPKVNIYSSLLPSRDDHSTFRQASGAPSVRAILHSLARFRVQNVIRRT
jgi:hypothetical protein